MKIAIFHNLSSGGGKRALFEMVRRLSGRHAIDVFTPSSADHNFCDLRPLVRQYRVFDFKTLGLFKTPFGRLNNGIRTLDIFRLRVVQRAIADVINKDLYDVVFAHTDQYTNSPIILKFLRIPSVYYCQDPLRKLYDPPIHRPYSHHRGLKSRLDRLNVFDALYLHTLGQEDKRALTSANRVLVNSYFSRETIYRFYQVSAHVCYLGVDSEKFKPLNLNKENYVLSVGSINPIKGFDFVIRSLAYVPVEQRPRLIIVGNFSTVDEKSYLEQEALANGVSVEFKVLVGDDQLVELYNRAQATLYAPVLEPLGLVPLESMACATPVIGVAEGGVRETVKDGQNGLLTGRDPKQFADAYKNLVKQPHLALQLGQNGPGYIREFWNWDAVVTNLEGHFEGVIAQTSTVTF
jgi:glycosyltransferase involved in cell wall biosynthesis